MYNIEKKPLTQKRDNGKIIIKLYKKLNKNAWKTLALSKS